MEQDTKFLVFLLVSVFFFILDSLLVFADKNVKFKRRMHISILVGYGAFFVFFIRWLGMFPEKMFLFLICCVIAVVFLNIRFTKFCKGCSEMIYIPQFTKIRYCPKCGNKM